MLMLCKKSWRDVLESACTVQVYVVLYICEYSERETAHSTQHAMAELTEFEALLQANTKDGIVRFGVIISLLENKQSQVDVSRSKIESLFIGEAHSLLLEYSEDERNTNVPEMKSPKEAFH